MSEIYQIVLTSSLTVLGGILIFVIGQLAVKFLIEPFQNYRKLVGEIADSLIYYGNIGSGLEEYYLSQLEQVQKMESPRKELVETRLKEIIANDWNRADEAKRILRQQASQLMSATNMIPMYRFWAFLRIVPKREEVIKASASLIGFSNSTQSGGIRKGIAEIAKSLRIKILAERFGE